MSRDGLEDQSPLFFWLSRIRFRLGSDRLTIDIQQASSRIRRHPRKSKALNQSTGPINSAQSLPQCEYKALIFLASYPKSGNTWLRFLVYVLTAGKSPETSRDVDDFANSRRVEASGPLPQFRKTHCLLSALSRDWPRTRCAIYVYRHPLDVLCSTLNYDDLTGQIEADPDPAVEAVRKQDRIDSFLSNAGAPEWISGDRNYGNWLDNVSGWVLEPTPFPVLALRYEDILSDPRSSVARIAEFLSIEATDSLVTLAIASTRFDTLRSMEAAEIAAANDAGRAMGRFSGEERRRAAARGVRFFNSGQSGQYRDILTRQQIERGRSTFGDVAHRLGYHF